MIKYWTIGTQIIVYTDGSCHSQYNIGAWSAIILVGNEKIILSGTTPDTTHQRMELTGAIMAMDHINTHFVDIVIVDFYTDSQYLTGLMARNEKLGKRNYINANGNEIRNIDLIKKWFEFNKYYNIKTNKIKAHQKLSDELRYHFEVDKLSRKLVRRAVAWKEKEQFI